MLPFSTQSHLSPLSSKANSDTIDYLDPMSLVPPTLEKASVVSSPMSSGRKRRLECSDQEGPKKKRSRMTKEQLAHLERFFAADCNPTTVRRREISLQIGIPERQVQIWFQNRRAKAKSIGGLRSKTRRTASPLMHPPELGQATQAAFATLIQEDDPSIFIIPCTYLTIGGWNRVSCSKWDLLAWICETKRCLTWFIQSKDYSFKMQLPLDCVEDLDFRNANPGRGILVLNLLQPPQFFLRKDIQPSDDYPPSCWKACDDWTENKEASLSLRHVLEGPARPLAYIVGYIKDRITNTVNRQSLSPPVVEYSPSSHSALSSSRDYYLGSLARCHPVPPEWSTTSGSENRHSNEPKISFSSYPNHGISSPSRALALHGMPDPQLCNDRTGFIGVGTMVDPASNSPSPLLIPQQLSYSSAQTPSGDRHLSPLLPGLSELFSVTKHS